MVFFFEGKLLLKYARARGGLSFRPAAVIDRATTRFTDYFKPRLLPDAVNPANCLFTGYIDAIC